MTKPKIMLSLPRPSDGPAIMAMSTRIELFSPEEVLTIEELWNEAQAKGPQASGYYFIIARQAEQVVGFACYGPRSLTTGTYDLYWIAVDPDYQHMGIGRLLLQQVEKEIIALDGHLIIVETSGQPKYQPTRDFYLAMNYQTEATIRDFYKPGDDLVIYTRHS